MTLTSARTIIRYHLQQAGLSPQLLTDLIQVHPDFETSGASSHGYHHAYKHGLIVHTAEVMDYVSEMAISSDDKKVLMIAALWHDVGKTIEYAEGGKQFRDLVGHVVGSPLLLVQLVYGDQNSQTSLTLQDLTKEQRYNLTHCMLAHHGKREWRAAVEPVTPEAHLLHRADMRSANEGPNKDRIDGDDL